MPYPETAHLVPHPPRHHFLLCAGTFRTYAFVLCATTQHPHSPPPIRAWRMEYPLQSFASTKSLRRFADILRPAAPPSWIDFVILSLRYHAVPHGIISSTTNDQCQNDRMCRTTIRRISSNGHLGCAHCRHFSSGFGHRSSVTFLLFCTRMRHVLPRQTSHASPRPINEKATPIAIDRVDCCLYSCICSLHLGPLFIRILSFLHNIEKSWGGGGATGSFRGIFGKKKKRRASKQIDLFARGASEPSIFCRRLVLIPTWS